MEYPRTVSERLGPFEILEEQTGSGATRIWRCAGEDGGMVVVEQLLPPLSRSRRFTTAVLEAARACEVVDHGNLAPVIWTQPIDGVPTLAEGRVPGHDVRAIYNQAFRRRASLPVAFSTQVVADAALGFGAAGRAHTFNRGGVAPQNIWVAEAGFGVAIHVARASLINRAFFARPDGPLQGSYTYASPDQIHGHAASARTDVFGLGIVLYEMTTGARLFKRRTAEEARAAVLACKVKPPSELLPGYPTALEKIVLKALRRQPAERWETPEQMARALEREVLDRMSAPRGAVRRFVEKLYPRRPEPEEPEPRAPRGSDRPAVRIVPREPAKPPANQPRARSTRSPAPPKPTAPPPASPPIEDQGAGAPAIETPEAKEVSASPAKSAPQPSPKPREALGPSSALDETASHSSTETPTEIRPLLEPPQTAEDQAPTHVRNIEDVAPDSGTPSQAPSDPPYEPTREPPPEAPAEPPPIWSEEEFAEAKRSGRRTMALAGLALAAAGTWALQSGQLSDLASLFPQTPLSSDGALEAPRPPPPLREPAPPKPEVKAPAVAGAPGRLALWVEPWAEVRLEGRDLGLTPLPETELSAGVHRLVIVNRELNLEWSGEVDVKPRTTTQLRIDLRSPSALRVSYEPVGGEDARPGPGG